MIAILDTTALSAAMRHDAGMTNFLRSRSPGDTATVPPVVAEIEYGIQRTDPSSSKRRCWNRRGIGSIKAGLERGGEMIDDVDVAIAAIAMSHVAGVLSAILVHFSRILGLSCRHWED